MSESHFRFSKQILRRLGEELNYSIDANILELVKNSFDADAKFCAIDLIDVDKPGGTIRISDDGNGMTKNDIAQGFLIIGESRKSAANRSKLGRIPAGSKGLGRIAALRMGTHAEIQTAPLKSPGLKYSLKIDWEEFEGPGVVEDVPLSIEENINKNNKYGTTVTISGLRSKVGRMEVKRLARSLILLADPFKIDPTSFQPKLNAPEFRDLELLIGEGYFKYADYHLQAILDHNGFAEVRVSDGYNQLLVKGSHEGIRGKNMAATPYACPPVNFEFWTYTLSSNHFVSKQVTLNEIKTWLKEVGGIHLYQNGLRVSPYGDPGNDWLGINLLRVKNPEMRPGTHTSIGLIEFEEINGMFLQKTDRAGFIETQSFYQLKEFAQDVLEWLARWRLKQRDLKKRKEKKKADEDIDEKKKEVLSAVKGTSKQKQKKIEDAVKKVSHAYEKKIKQLTEEVLLYRTLASAGIVSATFAHELTGNSIKILNTSLHSLKRRAIKYCKHFEDKLRPPIDQSLKATDSMTTLGSCIIKLVQHEKRRQGRLELHETIHSFIEYYKPIISARKSELAIELFEGSALLLGSKSSIETILVNLLNNALNAFVKEGDPHKTRIIRIQTRIEDDLICLDVSDNGPGIGSIELEDIWLPGQTTSEEGTGLGLTIVKDTVEDLGGKVKAIEKGDLGGAAIMVYLPYLGVNE